MFSIKTKVIFTFSFFFVSFMTFSQKGNSSKTSVSELSKVLEYFKEAGNSEQYQAATFLVDNIGDHYSSGNIWLDKSGIEVPFETTKFSDLEEAIKEFDKLKDNLHIVPKSIITNDRDVIQSTLLIKNIELAYKAWKQNPWSSNYDFSTFCEYILPYRSLTEPLENWRSEYQFVYQKSMGNLIDQNDPVELCSQIIKDTKHFDFVTKRFDPKALLSPSELLFWRQGNCPDLANVVLFAARSLGVAVTFDFTPHYAASSNRHFWNTVIDRHGTHIPFNGNQDLPYIYNPNHKRMGKVFRSTFSEQKQSLAAIISDNKIPEEFLKIKNIIDVTSEYVSVSDVNYSFERIETPEIAYICVFNLGYWHTIDWAKIKNNKTIFTNMGRNIVYLPSTFENGKMTFEKYPVLLDSKGIQSVLKPEFSKLYNATLSRSNETKNDFKENNPLQILKGENYSLFLWNGNWQLVDQQIAISDDSVLFSKIPENGLFLISSSKPDFFERIFTINPLTSKITWF